MVESTDVEFVILVFFGSELSLQFNFFKVFDKKKMIIVFDIQDDHNLKIFDTSYFESEVLEGEGKMEEEKEDISEYTT